jgi:hypothetical protein
MAAAEFQLYRYMLQNIPNCKDLIQLIEVVLGGRNHCQFKTFTLDIEASRMSGEMNTSLGNGFTNLMAFLFVAKEAGCTDIDGFVEGDDGIFRFFGKVPTAHDFAKLGLNMKIAIHEDICRASFCGIIADDIELKTIVDPVSEILGFGWTSREYRGARNTKLLGLLKSKALSMMYQYPGCPILSSLARYAMRMTEKARVFMPNVNIWTREKLTTAYTFYKVHGFVDEPVGFRTRLLMESVYGISVEDQLSIERYFDTKMDLSPMYIPALEKYIKPVSYHYYSNYTQTCRYDRDYIVMRPPINFDRVLPSRSRKLIKTVTQTAIRRRVHSVGIGAVSK